MDTIEIILSIIAVLIFVLIIGQSVEMYRAYKRYERLIEKKNDEPVIYRDEEDPKNEN